MGRDGEALRLSLCQDGVGRDERDGGSGLGAAFPDELAHVGRDPGRKPVAAELATFLKATRQEMRAVPDNSRGDAVHHHQGTDYVARGGYGTGRAQAALQVRRCGAVSAADRSEVEVQAGPLSGLVPELPIGRIAAPVLVAAVDEIEDGRLRD